MINNADVRLAYNNLYKEIRKYMWEFPAVEALADFEIACYKTCLDLYEVRDTFNQLFLYIRDIASEDEDMQESIDKLQDLINSSDTYYSDLYKVGEVLVTKDEEVDEEFDEDLDNEEDEDIEDSEEITDSEF